MRYRARIDDNQKQIVEALRKAGASVKSLAQLGSGCPDLLVGFKGINWLFEVKDPSKRPSQRELSEDERAFHAAWLGQIDVIENSTQAIEKISSVYRVTPGEYRDY